METVFRPAMDIVADVILDNVADDNFAIPKKPLLKRVANRFRAKKRPQEARDLDFEVCVIIFSIPKDRHHPKITLCFIKYIESE